MSFDKLLVIFGGAGLIGFIYWFFFGKKEDAVYVTDEIEILVKGGYKPETIKIKKGKETKLTFVRRDPSSCLEEVVLPDFKIKQYLPLNEPVTVSIKPNITGTFSMHCGMNMYHGKVIVN